MDVAENVEPGLREAAAVELNRRWEEMLARWAAESKAFFEEMKAAGCAMDVGGRRVERAR